MSEIEQINGQASLARKMAQTMGDLRRIEKGGENKDQKWKYATIDDITDAVRSAMANHGLALFTSMINCHTEVIGQTRSGANVTRATVELQFKIVCGETGASELMVWTGVADDYSDKAVNKAGTYATKFWMKNTFLISTGDDPDAESPEISTPKKPAPEPEKPIPWSDDYRLLLGLAVRAKQAGYIEHDDSSGIGEMLKLIAPKTWTDFPNREAAGNAIKVAAEALKAELEHKAAQEDHQPDPTFAPEKPAIRGKGTHEPDFVKSGGLNVTPKPEQFARAAQVEPDAEALAMGARELEPEI